MTHGDIMVLLFGICVSGFIIAVVLSAYKQGKLEHSFEAHVKREARLATEAANALRKEDQKRRFAAALNIEDVELRAMALSCLDWEVNGHD